MYAVWSCLTEGWPNECNISYNTIKHVFKNKVNKGMWRENYFCLNQHGCCRLLLLAFLLRLSLSWPLILQLELLWELLSSSVLLPGVLFSSVLMSWLERLMTHLDLSVESHVSACWASFFTCNLVNFFGCSSLAFANICGLLPSSKSVWALNVFQLSNEYIYWMYFNLEISNLTSKNVQKSNH